MEFRSIQHKKIAQYKSGQINGLDCYHYDYYNNAQFIGLDIEKMKDDETLLQFKQKVLNQLHQYERFKDTTIKDIQIIQESWDD